MQKKRYQKKRSSAEARRLLRPHFLLKGRNSLRSDSLPFLTQKTRAALHASSLRRGLRDESVSGFGWRLHAGWLSGLTVGALSGGCLPAVKKGRLFERSEFLPFRTEGIRSSPGSADGVLSFWYLFLSDKRKKKYMKAEYNLILYVL